MHHPGEELQQTGEGTDRHSSPVCILSVLHRRCICARLMATATGGRARCVALALVGFHLMVLAVSGCPSTCQCSSATLQCLDINSVFAIPSLGPQETDNITDILIENQPNLENITESDLASYKELRNLTITRCGLVHISERAFQHNVRLQYINLAFNSLEVISWRVFQSLPLISLILRNNPLSCSCDMFWLQKWEASGRGDVLSQSLSCFANGHTRQLQDVVLENCSVPEVSISSSHKTVHEGGNLTFVCQVTGLPTPKTRWNTQYLHSAYVLQDRVTGSGPELVLQLTNVSSRDNLHNLTCEAENQAGSGWSTVVLDIQCEWRAGLPA